MAGLRLARLHQLRVIGQRATTAANGTSSGTSSFKRPVPMPCPPVQVLQPAGGLQQVHPNCFLGNALPLGSMRPARDVVEQAGLAFMCGQERQCCLARAVMSIDAPPSPPPAPQAQADCTQPSCACTSSLAHSAPEDVHQRAAIHQFHKHVQPVALFACSGGQMQTDCTCSTVLH